MTNGRRPATARCLAICPSRSGPKKPAFPSRNSKSGRATVLTGSARTFTGGTESAGQPSMSNPRSRIKTPIACSAHGQGAKFTVIPKTRPLIGRPFIIRMIECKNILIDGITLRNSASWTESYLACDDVTIRDLTVEGHAIRNNDGIDIDGCQRVRISRVNSSTDDDGLCFKGTSLRPTKDVVVENCRFFSYCNSLKVGTDSQGGFENITIRHMELGGPAPGTPPNFLGRPEGTAGIALEVVDGALMQNINIDGAKIRGTKAPIYYCAGRSGKALERHRSSPAGHTPTSDQ